MRIFCSLWERVANFRFVWRLIVKLAIFFIFLLVILYPNPVLLVKQIHNYLDMESLIQPDFVGIETINRELNAIIPSEVSPQKKFLAIEQYVYQHIQYEYDWDNWGNIDFWPTAEQVWKRQREDCDGLAILAASILRSRGFKTATLVGNMRHIWVNVDQWELMGPDQEQNIRPEGGKTIVTLPSFNLMFGAMAIYVADFSTIRNLMLFFVMLVLCYHPRKNFTQFLSMTIVGLVGFILLKDWAQEMTNNHTVSVNINFISGWGLLCISILFSLFAKKTVSSM